MSRQAHEQRRRGIGFWGVGAAVAMAVAAAVLLASPAAAHEQRDVGGGRFSVTIGFIGEPAFVGQENGLWLRVTRLTGDLGPVEGLAATLGAEVIFGDQTMPLTLLPVTDEPGTYEARFVPTRAGDYTFHLTGQIEDQAIDETFRSSPSTFDSVQPASAVQFPDAVPAGSELTDELEKAQDDAASARTLAIVGIAIGAVGLVVGVGSIAFASRRRVRPPNPQPIPPAVPLSPRPRGEGEPTVSAEAPDQSR